MLMSELVAPTTPEVQPLTEVEILTGTDFFNRLATDLSVTGPGSRVAILTMDFEPSEPLVKPIVEELSAAADRKVEINLGVDAYAFLVDDGQKTVGPMFVPLPFGQKNYQKRRQVLEQLAQKPTINYSTINRPGRLLKNPFAGRSHIKLAIVNDKVYLGGPNFHKTERSDMVVALSDPKLADWLYGVSAQIVQAGNTAKVLGEEDIDLSLDSKTRILLDAGKPGQSLIMDEAIRLIDDASDRIFASFQFLPSGRLARRMSEAHERATNVKPFHNHPSQYNFLLNIHERFMQFSQAHKVPKSFFDARLPRQAEILHSKAIASEKAAIVGTHNFIDLGVRYGTPEIALHRQDPSFALAVGSLLVKQAYHSEPVYALEGEAPEVTVATNS